MSESRFPFRAPSEIVASTPAIQPWIWEGYLAPGAITIFSSRMKIGKSTLLTLLLQEMLTGGRLADAAVAKGRVLVASEEPERAWRPRLRQFDLESHVKINMRPFPDPPTQGEWEAYVRTMEETPADLYVVDSLLHFLPAHAENNGAGIRRAVAPLRRLSDRGAAVWAIHHPAQEERGDFNFRGHGGLQGDPEILMELKMPCGAGALDRRRILQVRSRLENQPPRRMMELDPTGKIYTVIAEPQGDDSFESGWPAMQIVFEDARERLTGESVLKQWPPDYWKPACRTLRRWLERALGEKRIERFGKGRRASPYRYALPGKKFQRFELGGGFDFEAMDRERYG